MKPLTDPKNVYNDFKQFHKENPEVYTLFQRFTDQVRHRGYKTFGARAIWEQLRWYTLIETTEEPYKLNNNYAPLYSRMLMLHQSGYKGFFKSRPKNSGVSDAQILADLPELLG